jgi:alpha-amylase
MYTKSRVKTIFALFWCHVFAASPAEWRDRSIYQIMTDRFARSDGSLVAECDVQEGRYCNGSWSGITQRLDYIQDMGFDAIWISPITHNLEEATAYGEAYHGYWQQDIYSLNAHFGTSDDLKTLAQALHSRGMVSRFVLCPKAYSQF